jgi:cellulose synthase/poly-beta-1,6-N-acetylglucosamine synthase-like glycosyltransferase
MFIPVLCLFFVLAYLVILVGLFFMVAARKAEPKTEREDWPGISVLVAARNEEDNILHCLQSLDDLDYPRHKIEILVGDDRSEDQTAKKVAGFAAGRSNIFLHHITTDMGKAKGKANVLAHLARKAKGEYFLITDADIVVSTGWAKDLIAHFTDPQKGIVSGLTLVHGPSIWSKLQGIDWLFFMGLLKGFDNAGLHCTAVGNNMAISKDAYLSVGGYEELDFSVTEDYKLYKEVRKKGWNTLNILTRESLNISLPVTSFTHLMHQRKRWLTGARELPFYWWLFFGILGLLFPATVVLALYQPLLALQLYCIKVGIQTLFILYLQHKLSIRQNILQALLYDIYSNIIALSTQVFFVLPITMQWKKRKYHKNQYPAK